MDVVRLHFPDSGTEPLPLAPGVHGIGWRDGRLEPVMPQAEMLLRFEVGARGIWMHVSQAACVHVNGRRVHQIALLRSGDVLHVDVAELRLVAEPSPLPHAQTQAPRRIADADPRWVLRGLGGHHHGRCFTLDGPREIGRSVNADISIDDPALGERHVRLERVQDQVLLRDLGAPDGSLVNGLRVRDAVLVAGDQVLFGTRHRFVIEAPQTGRPLPSMDNLAADKPAAPLTPAPHPHSSWHLLWLLVAAILMAAVLTGLLLFGTAV